MSRVERCCCCCLYVRPDWWYEQYFKESMMIPIILSEVVFELTYNKIDLVWFYYFMWINASFLRRVPHLWIYNLSIEPANPISFLGIVPPIVMMFWFIYAHFFETCWHVLWNPVAIPILILGFYGILPSVKRVRVT